MCYTRRVLEHYRVIYLLLFILALGILLSFTLYTGRLKNACSHENCIKLIRFVVILHLK